MELRHLRYFIAVAEHLNFTRAAKWLKVAQPSLSRQISQLEEELGVKLLKRNRPGVSLTEPGRAFLAEARFICDRSVKAIGIAKAAANREEATLRIGYAWGLFHSLVPEVIDRFRSENRGMRFELEDMTAIQQRKALLEHRIDAGFIGFELDAQENLLQTKRIGSCAFQAALPQRHELAKARLIDLQALANEPFCVISGETFPGVAHAAMEACARAGFRPKILETAPRGNMMLGLIAGNRGVAIMPEPLAGLPHPGVVFRPLRDPYYSDLFLAWNPGRDSATRDLFIQGVTY